MVNAVANRESISKLLDNLGTTMTVIPRTLSSTNKWGKQVFSVGTTYTTKAAPDNFFKFRRSAFPAGVLDSASMSLITKGDVSVGKHDLVSYNSKYYRLLRSQKYPLVGTPLAKQVALADVDVGVQELFGEDLWGYYPFNKGSVADVSGNSNDGTASSEIIIDAVNNASDWVAGRATNTTNTTYYTYGGAGISLNKNDQTVSYFYMDQREFTPTINLSGRKVTVYLYIRDAAALAKLASTQFRIASTNIDNDWARYQINVSELVVGRNILTYDIDNPTNTSGTPVYTAINSMRLELGMTSASLTSEDGEFVFNHLAYGSPIKGNGYDGSADGALYFSGPTTGATRIALPTSTDFRQASMTFACWVKPIIVEGTYQYLFWILDDEPAGRFHSDLAGLSFLNDGNEGCRSKFPVVVGNILNNWNHIILSYEYGVERRMYLNGVKVTATSSLGALTNNNSTSSIVYLGDDDSALTRGLKGYMDEVVLLTRAVTDAEALLLYNLYT